MSVEFRTTGPSEPLTLTSMVGRGVVGGTTTAGKLTTTESVANSARASLQLTVKVTLPPIAG